MVNMNSRWRLKTVTTASTLSNYEALPLISPFNPVLGHIGDTPFQSAQVCTASDNATRAWQNLRQDKARLANWLEMPID